MSTGKWHHITEISDYSDYGDHIIFYCKSDSSLYAPKVNISFVSPKVFRMQMSPMKMDLTTSGSSQYTIAENKRHIFISTSILILKVQKNPWSLSIHKKDNKKLITKEKLSRFDSSGSFKWYANKGLITKLKECFFTPSNEEFFGFGERFNRFYQRGHKVEMCVTNHYLDHKSDSYMPIPFFLSTKGYGIYVNSSRYCLFEMCTRKDDMYSFTLDASRVDNPLLDYYFIAGDTPKDVIINYTNITGKSALPSQWVFGPWMSSNGWDSQSRVMGEVNRTITEDIPATVVVIEAWSDEATFYIWNDAEYQPKSGDKIFSYEDFKFPSSGRWPDPKKMVDELHQKGLRVILWQNPVCYGANPNVQQKNDEKYIKKQGYYIKNPNSSDRIYRIPQKNWFSGGIPLDFTNPNAVRWWLSKRAYLFDMGTNDKGETVGIDGFKTDGGEHIKNADLIFYDGRRGDEMQNAYPNSYIKAYHDFVREKTHRDGITFSRAGFAGSQKFPCHWAGDERSTFKGFKQSIIAGLTAGISGISFWGWDLAGFTGTSRPTEELYARSAAMAAFCPIMQYHAIAYKEGKECLDRTPWSFSPKTMGIYRKYATIRMNLMPYIYSEAKRYSNTGLPLMRPLAIEYPEDKSYQDKIYEYLFGEFLLIAPVVYEGVETGDVYLPSGEWIDFWKETQYHGPQTITYPTPVDIIPVFIKSGAILPMTLNEDYIIGGSITNFSQLVFNMYPSGASSYEWYDDSSQTVRTIECIKRYTGANTEINLPVITTACTLIVHNSRPISVTENEDNLKKHESLNNLKAAAKGWWYDESRQIVYIKLNSATLPRKITLREG